MAREWNRDLDLQLAHAIFNHWGSIVWHSDEQRQLAWQAIFDSAQWPKGFFPSHLKDRWQENFRKWVPRERPKRATEVDFNVLITQIKSRSYREKHALPLGVGTMTLDADLPTSTKLRCHHSAAVLPDQARAQEPPGLREIVQAPVALPANYHVEHPSFSA